MKIVADLNKGQVVGADNNQMMVIDTGGLNISVFDGITDVDEVYKTSIRHGHVDHHTIDMLPVMENQNRKCATKMVVDYAQEVADYIKDNNIQQASIHKDTDMDALCAGWLTQQLAEKDKLPEISQEMADIVNKVDYAMYRKPAKEYADSFVGSFEAIRSSLSDDICNKIFSNPANMGDNGRLNDVGFAQLCDVDNKVNAEMFALLEVLADEKAKNPQFSLEGTNIKEFLENSDKVRPEIKNHLQLGSENILKAQERFEKSSADAKIIPFVFHNPQTGNKEKAQIVVMSSEHPLETLNLGYQNYPKNTVIAVFGGKDRKSADAYDIGVAPESASVFKDVMKQICIDVNLAEQEQRKEIKEKTHRTIAETKFLAELLGCNDRLAFDGADKYGITQKDPSPLVAGNSLVPASNHSLLTKETLVNTLKVCANNISRNQSNTMGAILNKNMHKR